MKLKHFNSKYTIFNEIFWILKNAPQDTLTQPMTSTAVSRVVIHHTELCVGVSVTVLRRTVTTSTDVLQPVSPDLVLIWHSVGLITVLLCAYF